MWYDYSGVLHTEIWRLARQSVLCGTHLLGGSDHYGPIPYRMQGGFPQACVSQSDRRQNEYRSNLFGLQEKRNSNGYLTNLYPRRVSKFVGPRKRSFVPAYLQGFRDWSLWRGSAISQWICRSKDVSCSQKVLMWTLQKRIGKIIIEQKRSLTCWNYR